MLLLDYINHIVAHSMVHKHGRLILLITNVYVLHGIKVLEIFLSFLTELIHGCSVRSEPHTLSITASHFMLYKLNV